jgi:hypothetical protein
MDFSIWAYLEERVNKGHLSSVEALKTKIRKEWAKLPEGYIKRTCRAFRRRLEDFINKEGG